MITTKINMSSLNRGVTSPKTPYSNYKEPNLQIGKPIGIAVKKLRKGKVLNLNSKISNEEFVPKTIPTKKEANLRKGSRLCVSGVSNLKQGTRLNIGSLSLSDGVALSVYTAILKRGKDLRSNKNILDFKHTEEVENSKLDGIITAVKPTLDVEVGDKVKVSEKPNELEITNVIKEQSREDNSLVDDDIVYRQGMSLYDFLKENPKKRTEDVILKYYNTNDLKILITSGKVLKKRGKLIL